MSGKGCRGYRAPGNYEPGRGKKKGPQRSGRAGTPPRNDAAGERGPARDTAPKQPRAPRATPKHQHLSATIVDAEEVSGQSFTDLGLGKNLVRELAELGARTPFAIQAATIQDTIAGRDVLGKARTGSGKTIAFGAGLVERLLKLKAEGAFGDPAPRGPRPKRGERVKRGPHRNPKAIILAPTRELALQIDRTVQPLARSVGFYTAQLVGGMPLDPQVHALERGVDVVIGTPGRIRDLVNRRRLDLREVLVSVIDEADQMCDLGFLEATQWVLRQTKRGAQRMLFSATLDSAVNELVDEFLRDPAVVEVRGGAEVSGNVRHRVLIVLREHKDDVLAQLAGMPGRILIFCRTRAYAERVTELLTSRGIKAVPLHGNLSQARRELHLSRFAEGKARVLVATDVAARGIHVDDVEVVLQADPPDDAKGYVHRAGRTGRAGRSGLVLTMIPRTRQKRTRELFDELGFAPESFTDFAPGDDNPR